MPFVTHLKFTRMTFQKDMLNDHPGLLKATKFVGQSQGKQEEDKGFNQKEQKRVSCLRGGTKHNLRRAIDYQRLQGWQI